MVLEFVEQKINSVWDVECGGGETDNEMMKMCMRVRIYQTDESYSDHLNQKRLIDCCRSFEGNE